MTRRIRNRHLFVSDLILLLLASYLCFVVRFDSFWFNPSTEGFLLFTLLMVPITLFVFHLSGLYRRYWPYASVDDVVMLAGAAAIATVAIEGAVVIAHILTVQGASSIPRSIPLIYLPLALMVTATPRFLLRVITQHLESAPRPDRVLRVLIVGAGRAGILIVREIQHNPQLGFHVVGFVDDDTSKHQMKIYGVPVLGTRDDIPALVRRHDIEQVIIAMPAVAGKTIRTIVEMCEHIPVPTRTMPGVYELLDGKVSVSQLRPVQIEDLLRREPVQTDIESVRNLIAGQCVLVTGAGGSIGSELCRQILRCHPAELVLVGHGENSIFLAHNELRTMYPAVTLHPVIADLRFPERLHAIFHTYHPDIVFHAAAHKHVPLMERNPSEAITNNVLGTRNLLDVSLATGVEHFVMISSDKAVNSTSIMGASKRVAEMLVHQAAKRSGRPFVSVRFGNVLGSRGSVVLTFKEQIAAGGPITITHPEMTRYFMTIPEAVQLVLQAAVLGQGGEVFVLDMGDPVKIVDLARDMIELSGLEEGRDIEIVYTGMRPGEKMYEELFVHSEQHRPTVHPKIRVAVRANQRANGHEPAAPAIPHGREPTTLDRDVDALVQAAHWCDERSMVRLLQTINPLYCPVPQPEQGKVVEMQRYQNGAGQARAVGGK